MAGGGAEFQRQMIATTRQFATIKNKKDGEAHAGAGKLKRKKYEDK
jgi:hypothetical protein